MSDTAKKNPDRDRSRALLHGTSAISASEAAPLSPRPVVRPKRGISIVLKLTLLVGLALALLLTALLGGSWLYWRAVVRKLVDVHLSAVAATRRDMLQAQIKQLLQFVELNTDRGEVRGFLYELATALPPSENRAASQISLDRMANGKPIVAASLADGTGIVRLSTDPAEVGRDVRDEAEFNAGLSGPHLGLPRSAHGRYEAVLAAPIRTLAEPNRIYGVLLATADVSPLASKLSDVTDLRQTGEAVLGVPEGDHVRFLFPPRNSPQTTTVPLAAAPALAAAASGADALFKTSDYRGVRVLAAGRPIGYGGWGLVVKMDESEAYTPIAAVLRLGVMFGLVVGALGLAAAYWLARSFTRPIRELAQAAARVAGGDYEAPVPVNSGDELGALSTSFNEMTAAIRARRAERDQAAEALREADRRKDEFLAMLGHELRNPLSAIANAGLLWREAADDAAATDLARGVIARQTEILSRLVDDLLDVARITEGKIELRKRPVDVGEAVNRAVEVVRPLLEERRHTLELSLAGGGQLRVDADPTRLEQIFVNVLANAAKYTPDGGRITVVERRDGRDAVITVSDNGIGIAPEMLSEIFRLFTQVDRSLDRTSGGLGIGLSLCHKLVELHGGTISAHSNGPGQGAAFTIRLPALQAAEPLAEPPSPARPAPAGQHRRILLVDDNQDTVRSLSRLLARRGHEVTTAHDGLSAVTLAHEFKPDVLLLDIGLPGLDGYSLARRLRAEGFAATPMIAISGYAQEGDRNRARDAGFDCHFAKPVDFEALAEVIAEGPVPMLADQ